MPRWRKLLPVSGWIMVLVMPLAQTAADTVAYEFTGSLPDPARFKADAGAGPGSMPPMAKPAKDVEVKVRKPAGGHSGH